MHRKLPPLEYLNQCFSLDSDTGFLFWKKRPLSHFKNSQYQELWNKRFSGKMCDVKSGIGYYLVAINSVRYKVHRIIYFIHYGIDPEQYQIDHKNGCRNDNRPSNLRLATQSQNTMNFKGPRSDNTHGSRGVHWNSHNKKWEATLHKNGKSKSLGVFSDKKIAEEVAYKARKDAFGEFFP